MTEAREPKAKRAGREGYPLFRKITTRWMDHDVYGHVNNVVYYSFFDTAVNAALIEAGMLDPATSAIIGLVAETGCRFAAPLLFPGDVDAGIRVAKLGTSSVRYEVGLFSAGEAEAAAEGFFVHVYVDRATRRPTALPSDMREFLTSLALATTPISPSCPPNRL